MQRSCTNRYGIMLKLKEDDAGRMKTKVLHASIAKQVAKDFKSSTPTQTLGDHITRNYKRRSLTIVSL